MLESRKTFLDTAGPKQVFESEDLKRFRQKLLTTLSFFLDGLKPTQRGTRTYWQNYKQDRPHYSQSEINFKSVTVKAWLERLKPSNVLDVGGNSGEFSLIAASLGATALCWDSDVGAIEKFYRSNADNVNLHPILAPIDSVHGGYGWSGREFNGLIHRFEGHVDTVLLLAVRHHLGIACAVRLEDIFELMRTISAKNIICEFLDVSDKRLIYLCQQYRRELSDFTIDKQKEAAIRAGYKIVEIAREGKNSPRELALLSRS